MRELLIHLYAHCAVLSQLFFFFLFETRKCVKLCLLNIQFKKKSNFARSVLFSQKLVKKIGTFKQTNKKKHTIIVFSKKKKKKCLAVTLKQRKKVLKLIAPLTSIMCVVICIGQFYTAQGCNGTASAMESGSSPAVCNRFLPLNE